MQTEQRVHKRGCRRRGRAARRRARGQRRARCARYSSRSHARPRRPPPATSMSRRRRPSRAPWVAAPDATRWLGGNPGAAEVVNIDKLDAPRRDARGPLTRLQLWFGELQAQSELSVPCEGRPAPGRPSQGPVGMAPWSGAVSALAGCHCRKPCSWAAVLRPYLGVGAVQASAPAPHARVECVRVTVCIFVTLQAVHARAVAPLRLCAGRARVIYVRERAVW